MPLRPCLGLPRQACSRLTDRPDSRCLACSTEWHRRRDQARGSRHERGYTTDHDRIRARLLPLAYGKPCPRCGQPMVRGQALDLGHSVPLRDDPTSKADRIEHARCNRAGLGDNDASLLIL